MLGALFLYSDGFRAWFGSKLVSLGSENMLLTNMCRLWILKIYPRPSLHHRCVHNFQKSLFSFNFTTFLFEMAISHIVRGAVMLNASNWLSQGFRWPKTHEKPFQKPKRPPAASHGHGARLAPKWSIPKSWKLWIFLLKSRKLQFHQTRGAVLGFRWV